MYPGRLDGCQVGQLAIIARLNATLFEEMVRTVMSGKALKLGFAGVRHCLLVYLFICGLFAYKYLFVCLLWCVLCYVPIDMFFHQSILLCSVAQGIQKYEFDVYLDIHRLRQGRKMEITNKFVKKWRDFNALVAYAERTDDVSLINKIKVLLHQ